MARAYGPGRSLIPGPLVGVAVCALVAFVVLQAHLPVRLGDLGAKALGGELATPKAIGQSTTVKGTGYRPSVLIVAQAPRSTRSRTHGVRVAKNHVLLAVPLRARNVGDRVWDTAYTTRVTLSDSTGVSYPVDPRFTRVRAAKLFPNVIMLKPGGRVRGVAVFDVPRSVRITTVEVKVGPGFSRVARWKVTPRQ
jgi:hypothetical protein